MFLLSTEVLGSLAEVFSFTYGQFLYNSHLFHFKLQNMLFNENENRHKTSMSAETANLPYVVQTSCEIFIYNIWY